MYKKMFLIQELNHDSIEIKKEIVINDFIDLFNKNAKRSEDTKGRCDFFIFSINGEYYYIDKKTLSEDYVKIYFDEKFYLKVDKDKIIDKLEKIKNRKAIIT